MSHPQSYTAYAFTKKNGNLEKINVEWKDPQEKQIVVKVLACGVCHRCRAYMQIFRLSLLYRFISDVGVQGQRYPGGTLPRIPGHEIVGDVVAIGPGEESFYKIGQRVGGGWHGGHCGRCESCRMGSFNTCEKAAVNGKENLASYHSCNLDTGTQEYLWMAVMPSM